MNKIIKKPHVNVLLFSLILLVLIISIPLGCGNATINTIAFISYSEDIESADIYLADLDGENLTRLTDDQLLNSNHKPVWSPKGDKIAFFSPSPADYTDGSLDSNTPNVLHIMDYEGNDIASVAGITGRGVSDPVWSPDASKIAFNYRDSDAGTFSVYMVDGNGNNLSLLDTVPGSMYAGQGQPVSTPIWSPDSSKIYVISDGSYYYPITSGHDAIYVIDTQGNRLISLEDDTRYYPQPGGSSDSGIHHRSPEWSPDGSKLMYTVYDGESRDFYVINADGTGSINLTKGNYGSGTYYGEWLPNSDKIILNAGIDGNYDIYIVNSNGTGFAKLTPDVDNFHWARPSPDGNKLLFNTSSNDTSEYYVMDADGSEPTKLHETLESVRGYTWSPDSTKLIFTSFNREKTETNLETTGTFPEMVFDIYVINADGTGLINVASNTGDTAAQTSPQWFPDSKRIVFSTGPYGGSDICVVNADGTGLIILTDDLGHSWGPAIPPVE